MLQPGKGNLLVFSFQNNTFLFVPLTSKLSKYNMMSMKPQELHNSQNSMTTDLHLLSSFCIEVYHLM